MLRNFPLKLSLTCAAILAVGLASPNLACAQAVIPYGAPISLEQAKGIIAAAQAEARKNSWPVAVTIVDSAGLLVAFERMDDTQLGSIEVSQEKAKSAVLFRRPTKAFEETLAGGGSGWRVLKTPGAFPIEGGFPIIVEGKIIGGIGVSGVQAVQDAQVANAGLEVLKVSSSSSPPPVSPEGRNNAPPGRGGREQ